MLSQTETLSTDRTVVAGVFCCYFCAQGRLNGPSADMESIVSSGGLVVKHTALGAMGHWFDPSKRSKPFQRLISRLTTSWVVDHVKWRCHLHWINKNKRGRQRPREDVKYYGSDHPQGILATSFHTAPLWVVGEEFSQPLQLRDTVLNKR